ncbi:MAG: ABC transporter permease [Ectothiorhodospiraceae bacterium]|nr:ABC transporter permease [Ectothiorhodospiraceae bacterium]
MPALARPELVALRTIVRKEIRRFLRIWVQTLLPPAITMTLYLVIFGRLIGSRIGEMGGHDYIDYIAPGVIMMAVITNSYSNVVSSFYGARFQRYVEEMLVSPTPIGVVLLGYVAGGVTRGLLVGLLVTLVAMVFADLRVESPLYTVAVVVLTSTLFSTAGFINALFARTFDDVSIVPTFVLTPLTYLGGVFFSVELLAEPWQSLARANPVLYMVNGFRHGMLGVSDIGPGVALALTGGAAVALLVLALLLLHRGVGIRS